MSDTRLVEVGAKGRVVIPARIRRELSIDEGTKLAVLVDDGAVVLVPRDVLEKRLHAKFARAQGMADELIAERRAEAEADARAEAESDARAG